MLIGWQVSLSTMMNVSPLLLQLGCKHVPLRRLTQDHVENMFCVVRSKNGFNDRPEVTAFRCAIRAVALSNLLRPMRNSGNCEADADHLLVNVLNATAAHKKGIQKSAAAATAVAASVLGAGVQLEDDTTISEDEEDVFDISNHEDDIYKVSRSEEQVVDMLGGYCITRLGKQKKLKCDECRQQLLQSCRNILLQEREYTECTKQALFSSSHDLFRFLLHTETVCRKVLHASMHMENIAASIREKVLKEAPKLQCCHPNDTAQAVLQLYLRVRLHHQSRLVNATMRLTRKSNTKNRKLKKLNAAQRI